MILVRAEAIDLVWCSRSVPNAASEPVSNDEIRDRHVGMSRRVAESLYGLEMSESADTDPPHDRPTDTPADGAPTDAARRPSRVPTILVVVATILAVVSVVTTWVRVQMLDTDEWVEVSDGLLADPEVQDALSSYLTNQLFERVDIATTFEDLLPDELSGLAGPLAGALRTPVANNVERLVASERFASAWRTANRVAHEKLVAVLLDETRPGVSTADGTVTLDLQPLVRNIGESIGLPEAALDRIPPDAGQFVVFESDQLARAQTTVQILEFLSWFLFIVVVGLYALAVFLARGRRSVMLRNVGIGLISGGLFLLAALSLSVRIVVRTVVRDPSNEAVGTVVAEVATELLRQTAWSGVVYGLTFLIFAFLIGSHRWAVGLRRGIGRVSESTVAMIGCGVAVVLLMIWWSPGGSFDSWRTALLLIGLTIGGVIALFSQVAAERRAAVSDTGE